MGSLGPRDLVLTQVPPSLKPQDLGQCGNSCCEDSALSSCACLLGAFSQWLASQTLFPSCKCRERHSPFPHTDGCLQAEGQSRCGGILATDLNDWHVELSALPYYLKKPQHTRSLKRSNGERWGITCDLPAGGV